MGFYCTANKMKDSKNIYNAILFEMKLIVDLQ